MGLVNDGCRDILVRNRQCLSRGRTKTATVCVRNARLAFRNLGNGNFEKLDDRAGLGLVAAHGSRGCAFGDFDNDGDVGILVGNLNEPLLIRMVLRANTNESRPICEE